MDSIKEHHKFLFLKTALSILLINFQSVKTKKFLLRSLTELEKDLIIYFQRC